MHRSDVVTGGFGRLLCARSRRGTPCLLVSAHVFGDQVESVLGALVRPPPSDCARRVSLSRRLSRPYRRAALVMALMLRLISRVKGAYVEAVPGSRRPRSVPFKPARSLDAGRVAAELQLRRMGLHDLQSPLHHARLTASAA